MRVRLAALFLTLLLRASHARLPARPPAGGATAPFSGSTLAYSRVLEEATHAEGFCREVPCDFSLVSAVKMGNVFRNDLRVYSRYKNG